MSYSEKINELIQKGEVADAIRYNPDFKVSKTGKELREKSESLITQSKVKMDLYLDLINQMKSTLRVQPNQKIPDYWYIGVDVSGTPAADIKRFSYELTEYPAPSKEERDMCITSCDSNLVAPPKQEDYSESEQESFLRCKYNELVRQFFECLVDYNTLDVFFRNLKDTDKYDMNAESLLAFGF